MDLHLWSHYSLSHRARRSKGARRDAQRSGRAHNLRGSADSARPYSRCLLPGPGCPLPITADYLRGWRHFLRMGATGTVWCYGVHCASTSNDRVTTTTAKVLFSSLTLAAGASVQCQPLVPWFHNATALPGLASARESAVGFNHSESLSAIVTDTIEPEHDIYV